MSYQVGSFCYATPADAGQAACARYEPVSGITAGGDAVIGTSCEGANPETGALQLRVATTPTNGSPTTYQVVEQMPAFAPCQYATVIEYFSVVIPFIVVALVLPWFVYKKISGFLEYRGQP